MSAVFDPELWRSTLRVYQAGGAKSIRRDPARPSLRAGRLVRRGYFFSKCTTSPL
jgi:hypothetical protein